MSVLVLYKWRGIKPLVRRRTKKEIDKMMNALINKLTTEN